MSVCLGCGEDWCDEHDSHRFDCGCPDIWDEPTEPELIDGKAGA